MELLYDIIMISVFYGDGMLSSDDLILFTMMFRISGVDKSSKITILGLKVFMELYFDGEVN